jgi:hypothetical protein
MAFLGSNEQWRGTIFSGLIDRGTTFLDQMPCDC